jgi:hypothetical protein
MVGRRRMAAVGGVTAERLGEGRENHQREDHHQVLHHQPPDRDAAVG